MKSPLAAKNIMFPLAEKLGNVATGWWLSGGVPVANCVTAFAPISAASASVALVNLNTPGTYDAVSFGADPTWTLSVGWTGNGSSQGLRIAYSPAQDKTTSVIVKYSGVTGIAKYIIGHEGPKGFFGIQPTANGSVMQMGNGTKVVPGAKYLSGIYAVSGSSGYRNGVAEGTSGAWGGIPTLQIGIFCRVTGASTQDAFCDGTISSMALYRNTSLTVAQILAIGAAMP